MNFSPFPQNIYNLEVNNERIINDLPFSLGSSLVGSRVISRETSAEMITESSDTSTTHLSEDMSPQKDILSLPKFSTGAD